MEFFVHTGLTFLYLLCISPLTANSLICLLVSLKRSLIFCTRWYLNFKVSCLNPLQELEDYFYYVQLRGHGIDSLETRQVSTHIPLEEIPSVMRAMGFYPSEEEVGQLLLLLLLKQKQRGRMIMFTKRADGQIPTAVTLDGSRLYLLAFNAVNLVCINIVVVRIWQQVPQKAMISLWRAGKPQDRLSKPGA